jgi:MerR family copper efflux transcriptional regulator
MQEHLTEAGMNGLTIGKVAARTGLGIDTIRFYEKEGLIPEPARRPSGFRDYDPDVLERLRFIRQAKALGFSLKEIADLLALRVDDKRTCEEVYRRTSEKIADIETRIRDLERIKAALANMAAACHGKGLQGECPILEALAHEREQGASA